MLLIHMRSIIEQSRVEIPHIEQSNTLKNQE